MRHVVRVGLTALAVAVAAAPAAAEQATAPLPFKKDAYSPSDPMPRRGFSVVLLVGDVQGPGYPKPIPEAAMRALADMRDFLPYKGYNLLDTQWIIGGTSSPAVTRLRGLDGQEYELELRASPLLTPGTAAPDPRAMSVRFVLRDVDTSGGSESGRTLPSKESGKADPAAAEVAREIFQLERERADLQIQVEHKRRNVEVGVGDPVEVQRIQTQLSAVTRRVQELKQQSLAATAKGSGRAVIDTSFRMDDGETVVVGTSKMKGGSNALIALLTATSDRPKASTK
jgi:hypothetical protein